MNLQFLRDSATSTLAAVNHFTAWEMINHKLCSPSRFTHLSATVGRQMMLVIAILSAVGIYATRRAAAHPRRPWLLASGGEVVHFYPRGMA